MQSTLTQTPSSQLKDSKQIGNPNLYDHKIFQNPMLTNLIEDTKELSSLCIT